MRTFIISIIAVAALQACSSKASENKNVESPDVIAVKAIPVQAVTSGTTINLSGLLSTENEATLSFKIAGVIENITVEEGQAVKKGQLLASLITNAQLIFTTTALQPLNNYKMLRRRSMWQSRHMTRPVSIKHIPESMHRLTAL
jgi:multidrug efflux pump subunit AcrA (membrane-fusion protein)